MSSRGGRSANTSHEQALAGVAFRAEPPAPGFEQFHTAEPAVLLSKVDGDELALLLESRPTTPFETPRQEGDQQQDSADEQHEEQNQHSLQKIPSVPPPMEGFIEPALLSPGSVDVYTETLRQEGGGEAAVARTKTWNTAGSKRGDLDASLTGDWQHDGTREWSVLHAKILYIVSLHANEEEDKEVDGQWFKMLHLLVLIYEGVDFQALSLPVAPLWMHVDDGGITRKLWLLVAQQGISIVNELCEAGHLNCLRIVSKDIWPTTGFQVSLSGQKWLRSAPRELEDQMDEFLRGPGAHSGEVLEVSVERMRLYLRTVSGYVRCSSITECGQVPYVSSPFIPLSLRYSTFAPTDNAYRAYECMLWDSEVVDKRSEALILSNVTACVSEWIPVGSNAISAIIDQVDGESHDHFARAPVTFSSSLDTQPSDTQMQHRDQLTQAMLLDWGGVGQAVNLEGFLMRSKAETVKKVQHFGIHMNANGVIICGLQLEAIQEREWDDVAPALLGRAVKDMHADSSFVLNDLISKLQRDVLACLFEGHELERVKHLWIGADAIEPRLPSAAQYKDGGRFENELVQVVGELQGAFDLGAEDMLFVGSGGLLSVGHTARKNEAIIVNFLQLNAIDVCVKKFFIRARILNDSLLDLHKAIMLDPENPGAEAKGRERLQKVGYDLQLLDTVLSHIVQSIKSWTAVERPREEVGRLLYEGLGLLHLQHEVLRRANDLERLIVRCRAEVKHLTEMADVEDRVRLEATYRSVQQHTKHLSLGQGAVLSHRGMIRLRGEVPIRVITLCVGSMLAFRVLHSLHAGVDINSNTPRWFELAFDGLNDTPFLLLAMVFGAVLCIAGTVMWYVESHRRQAHGYLWRKVQLNVRIKNLKALMKFLDSSGCEAAVHDVERTEGLDKKVITATFTDKGFFRWYGENPRVAITFDATNRWVLHAKFSWPYVAKRISTRDIKSIILEMLQDAGVIEKAVKKR